LSAEHLNAVPISTDNLGDRLIRDERAVSSDGIAENKPFKTPGARDVIQIHDKTIGCQRSKILYLACFFVEKVRDDAFGACAICVKKKSVIWIADWVIDRGCEITCRATLSNSGKNPTFG
jgi:hypothetical protein